MPVSYHKGCFPPGDAGIDWPALLPLIGPANAAVARFEGVLHGIPNPNVLLAPLTSQEAVLSSRIEGTRATLGEVLEYEAEGAIDDESTPQKADIREVLNYRSALAQASALLDGLPLSQRLIRETHERLMEGVRGRNKAPGEYRRIPNWIGPEGCSIEEASFIPCSVEDLPDAMTAWEKYIHTETPDVLVQLAILHAEFEAIHPFLDGNGRLGRLMIPLFLKSKGLLTAPNFYLSSYLEQHREAYYDRLRAVSSDGDWTGWCHFFLQAIIEQAEINQKKAQAIHELYTQRKDWIVEATRSQYGGRAIDWFFSHPIFVSSHFISDSDIPEPTAKRILRLVRGEGEGLLRDLRPASGRRPAVLAFPELLNICEGRDAF